MTNLSKIGSFVSPTWLIHASSTIPTVIDLVAFRILSRNRSSDQLPVAFLFSAIVGIGSWIIFNVFTKNTFLFLESTGVFVAYKIGHFLYTNREYQRIQVNEKLGPAIDQLLTPFTLHKHDAETGGKVQAEWTKNAEKASGILGLFLFITDNLFVDLKNKNKGNAKQMAEALMTDSRYENVKELFNYDKPISLPRVYRFIRGLSFIFETVNQDSIHYVPPQHTQYHTLIPGTKFEKNSFLLDAKNTYNGIMKKWNPVIQELAKIDSKMAAYLVPDEKPSPGDVDGNDNNPFKLHIPSMDSLAVPS